MKIGDCWMKIYVWGYINKVLNLRISVSVHSIDWSIEEQSEIKLSYEGGWEALGQATGLLGGCSLLPVVDGK